jgi:saccharopine dehydrogenase-like NADP-dependent oxidoreductase
MPLARIVISDSDPDRGKKAADSIEKESVESIQLDASEYPRLVSTLKDFDLAVGLTPGRMGY